MLRSVSVRSSAVNSQIQRQLQVAFDAFVLKARCFELRSDLLQGTTNALLLAPEKIERDCSGVVGLQELLALTLQLFLLTLEVRLFALHLLAARAELLTDHRLDAQAEARIKLHPVVVVLELLLDFVNQNRPEIADGALGVTARAVVVGGVLHAGRRSGVLDHESLTALTAVDGALQKVWMPADAFAVDVRGEYILDQLLGLMINEWLMTTVVLNTLKPRLTVVIRVRENFVYESFGYRSRRHPGCWCRRQASLVEMVNESVYIQTIVRDMKWQETRDRYRFVAAFDEADYLGISSTQAGPIETVGAFTMERLRVDDHFEDRFYSSEPMRRGSSYDLQFRRLPEPGAVDPYMLVGEWRRFHEPTRLATFDVAFLGKVPRLVWKFTGLAHLQSPGEPEPGQLLKLIKGQFVRARFPDLYGGLFSGVAWEW